VFNLVLFGFPHPRSWGDAQQYDAYAVNLLSNHGYSINGSTFSAVARTNQAERRGIVPKPEPDALRAAEKPFRAIHVCLKLTLRSSFG
jgi:hypothetical protein